MTAKWGVGTWCVAGLLVLLPSFWAQRGSSELEELRREIEALREGQARIERQLQQIQELLTALVRGGEARQIVLDAEGVVWKGEASAPLVLIEFTDYQCPFCARHARETMPQLEREYIGTGKVRYGVRAFPLPIHRQAFQAAEAARCAAEQGKFWPMHEQLFRNQGELEVEALVRYAQALELDVGAFRQCLQQGRYAEAVRRDMEQGRRAGVRGTPTFFLGVLDPQGKQVKVHRTIVGAHPYDTFRQAVESLLQAPQR